MRRVRVSIVVILLCAMSSCVNVTTERRAESFSRPPEGGYEEGSEVRVNTYGWNVLAASLHILLLPFKLVHHAVKIVL